MQVPRLIKKGCQPWKVPAFIMLYCEFPIYFYRIDVAGVYESISKQIHSTRVQLFMTQGGHYWWGKYQHS